MDFEQILATILNWLATEGVKILIALIILCVSFFVIKRLSRRIYRSMQKKNADKTISKVVFHTINYGAKILVAVCLLGYLGIETSSIAALITSLGVGVGLAVQGALSNFAGGILIIFTRPFKIDDYIAACGVDGTVEDINLIHTVLRTPDNKVITLPNGTLANETIVNYSVKDTRRVDFVFSIAYDADFALAQRLLLSTLEAHELVLSDPAPFVRMKEHGDSAIKIAARAWVNSADYWTVYFDLTERVKTVFDENGIVIPFNQLDVHLANAPKKAD